MLRIVAFLLLLAVALLFGGPPLARKFLHGFFRGVDVYVTFAQNGKNVVYKNPAGRLGHEDKPLDVVPREIFDSEKYEPYYNVCWFECGALFRCEHSFHRARENALYCDKAKTEGSFIGEVLEER
jgi:hypothetical protein